jgi:hypothetical protein
MQEYIVDVKRKTLPDDTQQWVASVNGKKYVASTEDALRDEVRQELLNDAAAKMGVPDVDKLAARLNRTWRVRIEEVKGDAGDDDDTPIFSLFD